MRTSCGLVWRCVCVCVAERCQECVCVTLCVCVCCWAASGVCLCVSVCVCVLLSSFRSVFVCVSVCVCCYQDINLLWWFDKQPSTVELCGFCRGFNFNNTSTVSSFRPWDTTSTQRLISSDQTLITNTQQEICYILSLKPVWILLLLLLLLLCPFHSLH